MSVNENPDVETESSERSSTFPVFQSREEYIKALEIWVNQARMWQNISSCFPYYLALNNTLQPNTSISPTQTIRNVQQQTNQFLRPSDLVENEGYEFIIPPVWKRVVAETIDFVILFVIKLALTLIALEIIDTSQWQFLKDDLIANISDIHLGTEITTLILILEGVHRIMVCMYEVYWLQGSNEITFGCATPGKSLVGITVVTATKMRLSETRNNRPTVLIYPAKDLGLFLAFGRSFIKNFILAVMFPFCFAFFLFQYNRTGYDIICNTLVVEYDPNPPKRNFVVA